MPAINDLYQTILDRKNNPREGSYTTSLFTKGLPRMAQKVGEEGVEVAVAALSQTDELLVGEIADLAYHVLVIMVARGIHPDDIDRELEKRRH